LPGDITAPTTRLPNCTNACAAALNVANNGNGNLDGLNSFTAAAGVEARAFFPDLADADLITGIIDNNTATFGHDFPMSKIDGSGFIPGTVTTTVAASMPGAINTVLGTPSGLYLALTNNAGAAPAVGNVGLKPKEAGAIDLKLDDGVPGTGSVVGIGTAAGGTTGCGTAIDNTGVYNSQASAENCGLYIRVQG
jgi:hypothetical protein